MSQKEFWIGLGITTLVASLCALSLHTITSLTVHWPFSATTIGLFFGLSVLIYYGGLKSAQAKNKNMFTNVVMGITMFKMLLAGGLVLTYALLAEPTNKLFVIPFFLIYLLYTAFEVYVMIKLARETGSEATTKSK